MWNLEFAFVYLPSSLLYRTHDTEVAEKVNVSPPRMLREVITPLLPSVFKGRVAFFLWPL